MPMRTSVCLAGLALLAVAVSGQATLEWTGIPVPTGHDMHSIITSSTVTVHGKSTEISFMPLHRSGEQFGGHIHGRNVQANGKPVKEYNETFGAKTGPNSDSISNNPDFSSILQVGSKLFGVTHYESPTPGVAYLSEYVQNPKTGALKTLRTKPVDFSQQDGLWVPCAGSVTPWQTHLGSEEYPTDAKDPAWTSTFSPLKPDTDLDEIAYLRYWGYYPNSSSPISADTVKTTGLYPYANGYPWETVVKEDFTETTTKLYTHGRISYEMSYVMPDNKTVYAGDDGINCIFTMFVANTVKNLKEGKNFCMKMTQTSPNGGVASAFEANVEWIEMPTPKEEDVKAAIKTTAFADLFESELCVGAPAPGSNIPGFATCATEGFKTVNVGATNDQQGCECLKLKPGKDALAAVFEKRRMAAYLGCTMELWRFEGISFNAGNNKLYAALTNIGSGMLNNRTTTTNNTAKVASGVVTHVNFDYGGPNHIRVVANSCGCVMELDVDPSNMRLTKARMTVCGIPKTKTVDMGSYSDSCDPNGIASPDNVAVIPEYNQLLIGEDTSRHLNNFIWIHNIGTAGSLTRVASTPLGAETTSPYWYTVGNFGYIMFVTQHPYGADTLHTDTSSSWEPFLQQNPVGKAATVGVIGPIPMPPPPEVAPANGPAVTFTATLPYTADKFTKDVETKYKAAVAAAAGTAAANVDIAAKFTRRQAGSATVETTVRAKDAAGQAAISSALGSGDALKNKLNAQLKARGVAESTAVTPVAAKESAAAVVDAPKSSAPAIRSFGMTFAVASVMLSVLSVAAH